MSIKDTLTVGFDAARDILSRKSPEILLGVGIASGIATVIFAVKATPKVMELKDEKDYLLKSVEEASETCTDDEYSAEDAKKDKLIITSKFVLGSAKACAPALIFGAVSIVSELSSFHILNNRFAELLSYTAALEGSFLAYRQRAKERFGEQVENELYYNIKALEVGELPAGEDGTDGTEAAKKKELKGYNRYSIYARLFDETSDKWDPNPEYRYRVLKSIEDGCNLLAVKRASKLPIGFVYGNEVYSRLDITSDKVENPENVKQDPGQFAGCLYFPDGNNPFGDNKINFTKCLDETWTDKTKDFVEGREKACWIDCNFYTIYHVVGKMYELMAKGMPYDQIRNELRKMA